MKKKSRQPTAQEIDLVRSHPMFSGLRDDLFAELTESARVLTFNKNDEIFRTGDRAKHFFVIAEGAVRLFRLKADGTEATVNIFRAPQSFGEAAFFLEGAFPVSADAIEQAALVRIDAAKIVDRIRSEPDLALRMLSSMSVHLKLLVNEIELLRVPTADRRVAEYLVQLSSRQIDPSHFSLPFPKSVIANRLGVTPETLSRSFAKLRLHGIQVSQDTVQIKDLEKVRNFAGVP